MLVGKSIANLRFEPVLTYGASVERFYYDISAVRVRTVSRNSASTVDALTDGNETLTVNIEKEAVFEIADGTVKQAGPLNPGTVIGGQIAVKVAVDLDARILYETVNCAALNTFDTGDLTTGSSTGVPISMSAPTTQIPLMITRMPAKLRTTYNQVMANMVWVVDPYLASDMEQFLISKNIDLAGYTFANGYNGKVSTAEVYVSANLTGTAVFTISSSYPANGDTITIGGVVFTFQDTVGTTAGNVVTGTGSGAGQSIALSCTHLAALINAPSTTTAYGVALSAADALIITDTLKLAATATATTVTIVGTGSGRMIISKSSTNTAITSNYINSYFGKKGAIDVVVQDLKEVEMRPCSDRRATNVFSSYLAGIKTFADGAKRFLDCKVSVQ